MPPVDTQERSPPASVVAPGAARPRRSKAASAAVASAPPASPSDGRRAADEGDRADAAALSRRLPPVPSTLRIPLAARAHGDALFPDLAAHDCHAAALLAALGDDGSAWLADRTTVHTVLARTRHLCTLARAFLGGMPGGRVVNLGCGLSNYFQWLDDGRARMTDADLPAVIALRRALLPAPGPRHDEHVIDLAAPGWWEALALPESRDETPLFVFSEGVSMYLPPLVVDALLATFGEHAPAGSWLAIDALSWLAVGHAAHHPSVGLTGAEFRWGVRHPPDVAAAHPRLRLRAVHPLLEGSGWPYAWAGSAFHALFGVPLYALYVLEAVD